MTTRVRTVDTSERDIAIATLTDAFRLDPLMRALIATPEKQATEQEEARLRELIGFMVASHLRNGCVLTTEPDCCIALWWDFQAPNVLEHFAAEDHRRLERVINFCDRTKRRIMSDRRSWYVVYLGTAPACRRRGHAASILQYLLHRANAEGCAIYLENTNEKNRRFYERSGLRFQERTFCHLDGGDDEKSTEFHRIPLDIMVVNKSEEATEKSPLYP